MTVCEPGSSAGRRTLVEAMISPWSRTVTAISLFGVTSDSTPTAMSGCISTMREAMASSWSAWARLLRPSATTDTQLKTAVMMIAPNAAAPATLVRSE